MYRVGAVCQLNPYSGGFRNSTGSVGINVPAEGGIYLDPLVAFTGKKSNGCCNEQQEPEKSCTELFRTFGSIGFHVLLLV
jgi:hypothetical protein